MLPHIQQITGQALNIEQGALYPSLYGLETRGALHTDWSVSDNIRKARFHPLTPQGRKHLREEVGKSNRLTAAMAANSERRPRHSHQRTAMRLNGPGPARPI